MNQQERERLRAAARKKIAKAAQLELDRSGRVDLEGRTARHRAILLRAEAEDLLKEARS